MQQHNKKIRNILLLFLTILSQTKLAIMDLIIMRPHLHHERGQLIQSCLFNPFNNSKILLLFCKNTSRPPASRYLPLTIKKKTKNAKYKAFKKHKLTTH